MVFGAAGFGHRTLHRGRQAIEALRSHRCQKIVPILEMAIGCVVRDSCPASDLPKGKAIRTGLGDQCGTSIEQLLPQISVVVGRLFFHTIFIANYVDSDNIEV